MVMHTSGAGNVDEATCKIEPVQKEVARLVGWQVSLNAVSGLLTAAFYGLYADKYGRRAVLLLSCTGVWLGIAWTMVICRFSDFFPTRLVLGSALFNLFGGGDRVLVSMLYTMVSDSTEHSNRIKQLLLLAATADISRCVAPPFEAWAMARSLWLPFGLGLSAYGLIYVVVLTMQETHSITDNSPTIDTVSPSADIPDEFSPTEPLLLSSEGSSHSTVANVQASDEGAETQALAAKTKFSDMLANRNVVVCFVELFLRRVAFMSENYFYQYASERFGLQLRQTPLFRLAQALGSLLANGLGLPIISAQLRGIGVSSMCTDLYMLRLSLLVLTTGFLAIGAAKSPRSFGLSIFYQGTGEGLEPTAQAVAAASMSPDQYAYLFTILAALDNLGKIVSGPATAEIYAWGRDESHHPNGLCFFVTSGIFGVALLGTWGIKSSFVKHAPANTITS